MFRIEGLMLGRRALFVALVCALGATGVQAQVPFTPPGAEAPPARRKALPARKSAPPAHKLPLQKNATVQKQQKQRGPKILKLKPQRPAVAKKVAPEPPPLPGPAAPRLPAVDPNEVQLVSPSRRSRVIVPVAEPAAADAQPSAPTSVVVAPPPLVIAAPPPPLAIAAPPAPAAAPAGDSSAGEMGFDLLGAAPASAVAQVDPIVLQQMGQRRLLLNVHQGLGLALVGMMGASVVTGQLNYSDRFGGASTGRWENPHKIFTTITLGTFAATGLAAFFAPVPMERQRDGIDRVFIHEAGMIGATAGMVSLGVLGVVTASREGYSNQSTLASAHLVVGYVTLACMVTALSALIF